HRAGTGGRREIARQTADRGLPLDPADGDLRQGGPPNLDERRRPATERRRTRQEDRGTAGQVSCIETVKRVHADSVPRIQSRLRDLNPGPQLYESCALPLS